MQISLFIQLGIIGGSEVLLISLVVLLLFGGRKIPELMKGLGQGIREFKKAAAADDVTKDLKEVKKEFDSVSDEIKNSAKI
jgi:sec-independent protein translocase protein TatA